MKLHMQYLRSLEESERVREACLNYMQTWYGAFFPDRPDIMAELQTVTRALGGELQKPQLRWRYALIQSVFGWKAAKRLQANIAEGKSSLLRSWDKVMFERENRVAFR
jgi:hypothetical protein